MSTPETPRCWTDVLMREDGRLETHGVTVPTPRNFGVITVYEAASVDAERERLLDLLERTWQDVLAEYGPHFDTEPELADLLREYGRLGKEGS